MKRFSAAVLLFVLVTVGLYLSKVQQLPPSPNSKSKPISPITTKYFNTGERSQESFLTDEQAIENYQLAKKIRNCRNIPTSDVELNAWLELSLQNNEPQAYIDDVLNKFDQCKNLITPNSNYIGLLTTAAKHLNDEAISELWSISDKEYFDIIQLENNNRESIVSARERFLGLKYQLAAAAAEQGGELSLLHLVQGYQNYDPETKQPNYTKALAYAYFTLSVTQDNNLYRKVDWIKQNLEQKLSYQNIEQAQQLKAQFIENSQE